MLIVFNYIHSLTKCQIFEDFFDFYVKLSVFWFLNSICKKYHKCGIFSSSFLLYFIYNFLILIRKSDYKYFQPEKWSNQR